ncbi:MAG: macrolide export ATP-binding/permease MacB [Chitinophagaceae bacterium]|nr:macrolide export ATP-binding/permease MacB [Chitinophagaceae bacterium]
MFKNYIRISVRNLMKYKFISFINLFGLTVGFACCLLILSYILNEVSFDKNQPNANNVYRVTRSFHNDQGVVSLKLSAVAPPVGPLLKNDFPEVKSMTRLLSNGNTSFVFGDKKFFETKVFFADENIGNVFDVKMKSGSLKQALEQPFHILITEEVAKKYFGNENPVNKLVRLDNQLNCTVAGVYQAFPSNTHVHPEILISFNTLKDTSVYGEEGLRTNWGNNSFYTYITLPANYDGKKLEAQLPAFIDRHMHFPGEPANFKGSKFTHLYLQKFTDIHLNSHLDDEIEANGDIKRVYIFSVIAFFILLIAGINYMNLSTARSSLRAKEIGIRKTIGARKKEIIWQFLSESVFISLVALVLAIAISALALPWLNKLTGQELSLSILLKWYILLPLFVTPFLVGVLSGLYPALFMSSFQPVKVLKGVFSTGKSTFSFRQVLVVFQFAVSIILIICTAIVFRQLKYVQEKSLGLNKDHVITMSYTTALAPQYDAFRNELLRNPGIKSISRSSRIPSGRLLDALGVALPAGDSMQPQQLDVKWMRIDEDFIPTYGIQMAAGRNFSRDFSTDTSSFVLNEAAVKIIGWKSPQAALGKKVQYGGRLGTVAGVVKDFHFESLHEKIVPILFQLPPRRGYNRLSVKLTGQNLQATLKYVEHVWTKFLPETPYSFTFQDENFNKLYEAEQKQGTLISSFACIAIFIACLGLFGLSAFTISQRVKEIGIRKVLGASINNIVQLLSKDFLKLVGISAVIAFPVAWYSMHQWLQDFAYRTNISWWIFAVSAAIAALIALVTIGVQAVKAAMANPVNSLRTE